MRISLYDGEGLRVRMKEQEKVEEDFPLCGEGDQAGLKQ